MTIEPRGTNLTQRSTRLGDMTLPIPEISTKLAQLWGITLQGSSIGQKTSKSCFFENMGAPKSSKSRPFQDGPIFFKIRYDSFAR